MQRIARALPRHLSRRLPTPPPRPYSSQPTFTTGPSPPRLPKEDQALFESLQKQSTGAFSTPSDVRARINQSPDSSSSSSSSSEVQIREGEAAQGGEAPKIKDGEEFHPNMRRGAPPEFEGDTNPKTGEVGGPKNEPLRWGSGGDWSFNGRVTDF